MTHLSSAPLRFRAFTMESGEKSMPSLRCAGGSSHFLDGSPWAPHFSFVELQFPHRQHDTLGSDNTWSRTEDGPLIFTNV